MSRFQEVVICLSGLPLLWFLSWVAYVAVIDTYFRFTVGPYPKRSIERIRRDGGW
jgi:hypothetical protein